MWKIKHYLRHENKATKIEYYHAAGFQDVKQSKTPKKLFIFMSNLQSYYHFKLDFQNVDQHTGGKWLIHGTKRRKDNQLLRLELPCRIS